MDVHFFQTEHKETHYSLQKQFKGTVHTKSLLILSPHVVPSLISFFCRTQKVEYLKNILAAHFHIVKVNGDWGYQASKVGSWRKSWRIQKGEYFKNILSALVQIGTGAADHKKKDLKKKKKKKKNDIE